MLRSEAPECEAASGRTGHGHTSDVPEDRAETQATASKHMENCVGKHGNEGWDVRRNGSEEVSA